MVGGDQVDGSRSIEPNDPPISPEPIVQGHSVPSSKRTRSNSVQSFPCAGMPTTSAANPTIARCGVRRERRPDHDAQGAARWLPRRGDSLCDVRPRGSPDRRQSRYEHRRYRLRHRRSDGERVHRRTLSRHHATCSQWARSIVPQRSTRARNGSASSRYPQFE